MVEEVRKEEEEEEGVGEGGKNEMCAYTCAIVRVKR